MIKIISRIIGFGIFLASIIWYYYEGGFEPLITAGGIVIGLIGTFVFPAKQSLGVKILEIPDILNRIMEGVETKYRIHERETLSPSIEKTINEEGSKGWDLPQPTLANRIFKIYLNEVSVFSSIISDVTLSFTSDSRLNLEDPAFSKLFNKLLANHNLRLKEYHNLYITEVFGFVDHEYPEQFIEHFNEQLDIETKLRCKELLLTLRIYNSSICSEMTFATWKPPKKIDPEPHTFTEE